MKRYYGKLSGSAVRSALELYKPEEEKMKEITVQPEKWERLVGILVAIEPMETQYGRKEAIVLKLQDGSKRTVFKTATMAGLTNKHIGSKVRLVREIRPDGKSHIRVFVEDRTPAEDAGEPDYDPFVDE